MTLESNQATPTSSTTFVTTRDVKGGLVSGDTPLDFIKKNIVTTQPSQEINPTEVIAKVEADIKEQKEVVEAKPQETVTPEYPIDIKEKTDDKQVAQVPSEPKDDTTPAAENFKKLRNKAAESDRAAKELQDKLDQKEKELQDYKTGAVVPDVMLEKEAEIARLTKYRDIVDLKMSPAYDEKVIKPLTNITKELEAIATDYEIDPSIIYHAASITNRAELNRFLTQQGLDEVGALEVKEKLTKYKELRATADQMEREPLKAFQEMKSELDTIQKAKVAHNRNALASLSRDAWIDALTQIRQENKAQELIMRDNDSAHNDNIVRPILTQAAIEYGKIVKSLAEGGLEVLPKDAAKALATLTLLAHASAVSIESRTQAAQYAEELEKNTERTLTYIRPNIGGNSGAEKTAPMEPQSPKEAAKILTNRVLSGTRA